MTNTTKVIATIPARGGSKRIINKNIRMLNGHPLLAYTIVAALNTVKAIHDDIGADFLDASGDTITGDLNFTSGGVQATGQYLNMGVGGINTIRINTSNRVGVGLSIFDNSFLPVVLGDFAPALTINWHPGARQLISFLAELGP